MHLKALRIRGFKSFPRPTELVFEPGIAVVVGPNGSGKSNIADALQWAMGAASPSAIRAAGAADVLFAGSDGRPPAGVCEVELVLDNACATLPVDFDEVSVGRRLHRDGQGEYFVNRARVRRLDVVELLSDAGLGRELHSVIGQGRVEEILLSRAEDRRRLVEEAAGLGKYQRRRSRAEAKLARVAADLERARDLEREVRARLRPLALQASAAERAAVLGGEVARLRLRLLLSELAEERQQGTALAGEAERRARRRMEAEATVRELEGRRAQAEAELAGLASAQERETRRYYGLVGAGDRLEARRDQLRTALRVLERLEGRREDEAHARGADAERLEQEARAAARAAEAAGAQAQEAAGAGDEGAGEAAAACEAALAAALEERRRLASAEGRVETARRERADAARRREALEVRLARAAEEATTAGAALDEAEGRAGACAVEAAESTQRAEGARGDAVEASRLAADARREADGTAAEAREREQAVELAASRLRSLAAAVERGEGLAPGARALAESGATLLLAGVEPVPGYERALAAALHWRAQAVCAGGLEEALSLLEQATGDVAVVLSTAGAAPRAAERPPGGRALADVVRSARGAAARLLDGIWLVDDLAAVHSGVAVTPAGVGLDADRGELWRSGEAGEGAWLSARAEHDRLARELEGLRRAAETASANARASEEAAAAAAERAAAAQSAAATAEEAAEAAAGRARAATAERERLAGVLAGARAAAEAGAREREALDARLAELDAELAAGERDAQEARDAVAGAQRRHARLDARRRELAERAAERAARAARLRERAEGLAAEERRLAQEAGAAHAAARRATEQAAALAAERPAGERALATLEAALAAARALEAPAHREIEALERRTGELASALQSCAAEEARAQAALHDAAAAATGAEVARARSEERAAELERRRDELLAEHELPADAGEDVPALPPEESAAVAARLARLERRREALGAVNPLAAAEYAAERERADELGAQCDDLERSLRELRSLVADLTQTIERRFAETFGTVARNFEEVVATLFPGGTGRLRLTTPDVVAARRDGTEEGEAEPSPVQAGVELEVRPRGKRIESLALLSGGEKALAAIAFLFALLLARPSPFYVLDEVEAALDDANIERFLELLRALRDRAQFIVVTHQRRTMEVAEVLYGVTMGPDGESRVLSRRMPTALQAPAQQLSV